ncbi:TPA: ead/Ea22-like family protein [Enterobacter asburiae]|nr:ead/Ea22-like family protein [Enterobacter asburiae]
MSNIDKRALREAAEKATPGVWVYLPKNTSIEYDYGSDDSQGSVTYMDSGDFTQKQTDLNGAFIAAANPATVLALLDELEAVKCKLSDSKLLSLANDIVENLVDTGCSDPEYTQQYVDWTFKRIRAAAGKGED